MKCRICDSAAEPAFSTLVLNRYNVEYYRCQRCDFLQSEKPYWLDLAYSSAISVLDTGILSRNVAIAERLAAIFPYLMKQNVEMEVLDYGGGYGILVRLMRDIGFDFFWHDKYCENLFAKGFEKRKQRYPIVTAFEVIEHLINPTEDIQNILSDTSFETLVFSTQLYGDNPPDRDWWYYSSETGQHIAFYNTSTLKFIASFLKMNLYSYGNFHVLTYHSLSKFKICWSLVNSKRLSRKISRKLTSKTFSDYVLLADQGLNSGNESDS